MTASKPERLTVWRADAEWDDDEIVVKASDYDALEAARAADKARIKLLEEQRDAFSMHKMASRQCIGIPASVGVCEPVEGFAERPQDLAPAMREMALIIESDKARIAELEGLLADAAQEVEEWGAYASEYFQEKHDLAGTVARFRAALAQQGKEGEA